MELDVATHDHRDEDRIEHRDQAINPKDECGRERPGAWFEHRQQPGRDGEQQPGERQRRREADAKAEERAVRNRKTAQRHHRKGDHGHRRTDRADQEAPTEKRRDDLLDRAHDADDLLAMGGRDGDLDATPDRRHGQDQEEGVDRHQEHIDGEGQHIVDRPEAPLRPAADFGRNSVDVRLHRAFDALDEVREGLAPGPTLTAPGQHREQLTSRTAARTGRFTQIKRRLIGCPPFRRDQRPGPSLADRRDLGAGFKARGQVAGLADAGDPGGVTMEGLRPQRRHPGLPSRAVCDRDEGSRLVDLGDGQQGKVRLPSTVRIGVHFGCRHGRPARRG